MFLQASFPSSLPLHTSALDNHWSAFCHCSSAFSKIFCKWNPAVFSFVSSFHSAWCSWDSNRIVACAIDPHIPLVLCLVQPTTCKKYSGKKFQKAQKQNWNFTAMPATIFICTLGIIHNLLLDQVESARLRPWSQATDTRLLWREVQHLLLSEVQES